MPIAAPGKPYREVFEKEPVIRIYGTTWYRREEDKPTKVVEAPPEMPEAPVPTIRYFPPSKITSRLPLKPIYTLKLPLERWE